MTVWTNPLEAQPTAPEHAFPTDQDHASPELPVPSEVQDSRPKTQDSRLKTPAPRYNEHGWVMPSSLAATPDEARIAIPLPPFDELLLEKARVISGRFPFAEAEYRNLRATEPRSVGETPHLAMVSRSTAPI